MLTQVGGDAMEVSVVWDSKDGRLIINGDEMKKRYRSSDAIKVVASAFERAEDKEVLDSAVKQAKSS